MQVLTDNKISIGDKIQSKRDHKIYTVIGYSLEYHIVSGDMDKPFYVHRFKHINFYPSGINNELYIINYKQSNQLYKSY